MRAAYSVDHVFSLYFDYLLFWLFPVLVMGWELCSDCTNSWSLRVCCLFSVHWQLKKKKDTHHANKSV